MILILSNENEPSTDAVIDYLIYKGANFVRINSEDFSASAELHVDLSENSMVIGGQEINFDEINVSWYRRWNSYDFKLNLKTAFKDQIFNEIAEELDQLSQFMFLKLGERKFLSDPQALKKHNKLYTLSLAREIGFNIPHSEIINKKNRLKEYDSAEYITKPIADSFAFSGTGEYLYKTFTEPISRDAIDNLGEFFFPSLFQQRIYAEFEIRSFYLDGEFFSTAILNSETLDVKRSVGFHAERVKMVPIELPEDIRERLKLLMVKLGLNCGSIDLIKGKDGEFYFLEVNPIGQFLGYSNACNYQIETKIANWLIENDHGEI
ncbi:MAG: hypothetical protein K0R59_2008 [Sphingobacterium sp.]|jgi:ATP-GRASP peptide maturase of grasp-with-spasm system|nr:hypothetical protein [Sphingobacterium sp.]